MVGRKRTYCGGQWFQGIPQRLKMVLFQSSTLLLLRDTNHFWGYERCTRFWAFELWSFRPTIIDQTQCDDVFTVFLEFHIFVHETLTCLTSTSLVSGTNYPYLMGCFPWKTPMRTLKKSVWVTFHHKGYRFLLENSDFMLSRVQQHHEMMAGLCRFLKCRFRPHKKNEKMAKKKVCVKLHFKNRSIVTPTTAWI